MECSRRSRCTAFQSDRTDQTRVNYILYALICSRNFLSFFFLHFLVSGFKQSHTSRAVCCRLEKAADPVRVHHPMIGK